VSSFLLDRKTAIDDLKQNDGTTPLYQAALQGNLEAVTALLKFPIDVNNRNNYNRGPY
jgi:ankyrin repeat protein